MTSAFYVNELICWGSNGSIEDVLSRAADLSAEMFGTDDPLSIFLAEERKQYWTGKTINLQAPAVSLDRVAAVLDGARERAIVSGTFSEHGISWLNESLADFCRQVRCAAQSGEG